eukprot:scaffold1470_cov195-Cylindrotheca_fusiformis.AAC.2
MAIAEAGVSFVAALLQTIESFVRASCYVENPVVRKVFIQYRTLRVNSSTTTLTKYLTWLGFLSPHYY